VANRRRDAGALGQFLPKIERHGTDEGFAKGFFVW
jgi:hypothetical protein